MNAHNIHEVDERDEYDTHRKLYSYREDIRCDGYELPLFVNFYIYDNKLKLSLGERSRDYDALRGDLCKQRKTSNTE